MKTKSILSLTALAGALAFTTVAHAEHDRRDDARQVRYEFVDDNDQLDVIDRARLSGRRGEVSFEFKAGMRRDGLQLTTDSGPLTILSIELVYSDGRVTKLGRASLRRGEELVIQRGRPAGLRHVNVKYAMGRNARRGTLSLSQIHDGDGYTDENDLRDPQRGTWRDYPDQHVADHDGYWSRERTGRYRSYDRD